MAQPTVEAADQAVPDSSQTKPQTAGGQIHCPLCGFPADGENGIYVHLQTSHRKSTISRFVTDEL